MADAERVTARQRAILTAIIESYIETGEPVGSGTIARLQSGEGSGLSSATVRNEMAELADEGLLEQPHTSAGRVPTARAFRMYVEQLSGGPIRGSMRRGCRRCRGRKLTLVFKGLQGRRRCWNGRRTYWRRCRAEWVWRLRRRRMETCWNMCIFRGWPRRGY